MSGIEAIIIILGERGPIASLYARDVVVPRAPYEDIAPHLAVRAQGPGANLSSWFHASPRGRSRPARDGALAQYSGDEVRDVEAGREEAHGFPSARSTAVAAAACSETVESVGTPRVTNRGE